MTIGIQNAEPIVTPGEPIHATKTLVACQFCHGQGFTPSESICSACKGQGKLYIHITEHGTPRTTQILHD